MYWYVPEAIDTLLEDFERFMEENQVGSLHKDMAEAINKMPQYQALPTPYP
jgi:hypothetical protein